MNAPPQPAHLVSVPQLSQMRGVPYRTLHRDLLALWHADIAEGGGDWLLRTGRRRKLWVNLSRLRVAHPVLFEQKPVTKDDFDAIRAKVERLENYTKQLSFRINAVGSRVRTLPKTLPTLPLPAIGSHTPLEGAER